MMDMEQAMHERHMVRKYLDKPIPVGVMEKLEERVQKNNEAYGLSIKLMTDNGSAIPAAIKLLLAKDVNNFFIMAGPDGTDERLGYAGADLMLYAQTLGLNTRWVGGTFSRKTVQREADGAKPVGVVVVGYGETQGKPHKTKTVAQVSSYDGPAPQWFTDGVKAALLAPTALDKQDFFITGKGHDVSITCEKSIFAEVNKGLVKYHFELGAGAQNFTWVQ